MRAGRDAHRPRPADVVVDGAQHQVVVEHLDTAVVAIGDEHVAARIGLDAVRGVELQRFGTADADRLDEAAVLVVLRHTRVVVPVGDEDVALRVPGDVGWAIEAVRRRLGHRRRRRDQPFDRFMTAPHHHLDLAFGVELDDRVGAFVNRPDVVLGIDAHGVRHREAVGAAPDLLHEIPVLIELEEAR